MLGVILWELNTSQDKIADARLIRPTQYTTPASLKSCIREPPPPPPPPWCKQEGNCNQRVLSACSKCTLPTLPVKQNTYRVLIPPFLRWQLSALPENVGHFQLCSRPGQVGIGQLLVGERYRGGYLSSLTCSRPHVHNHNHTRTHTHTHVRTHTHSNTTDHWPHQTTLVIGLNALAYTASRA